MKKRYNLLFLFLSTLSYTHAQNPTWVKGIDSLRKAPPFYVTTECSMAKDADDNLYITGPFQDSVDIDPGAGVQYIKAPDSDWGSFGLFLAKYNANGDLQWVKTLDGAENYRATPTSIVFYDQAIYMSGYLSDTVDFDPGPGVYNLSTTSVNAGFIAKYDNSGNLIWARKIATPSGISSSCQIGKIKIVSDHFYFGGSFKGTIDFDGSSNVVNLSANTRNLFMAKYDTAGNYIWAKNFGAKLNATSFGSFTLDSSENIWVTGGFNDSVYFSSTDWVSSTHYGSNVFFARYDKDGNYLSAKILEEYNSLPGYLVNKEIETDRKGNLYLTGWFSGNFDFDPGADTAELQTLYGISTLFVAKYDTGGNYVWATTVIGDYSQAFALAVDTFGLVSITGFFQATLDFGNLNVLNSTSDYDIFVAVYDQENGHFMWANQFGASVSGVGYFDIIPGDLGSLYIMGTPTDPTYCNIAFARYGQYQTITTQPQNKTICSGKRAALRVNAKGIKLQYQWKKNGNPIIGATTDTLAFDTALVNHSGKYTVSIRSPFGVIESDTVILTVNPSYRDTLRVEICEGTTFTFGPYVLNVPGEYDRTFQTVNGCDSMVNLTLSFKPVYNETVSINTCDFYLFGEDTLKLSGVYDHTFQSANACDSNVTLTLNLSFSSSENISVASCRSFVFAGDTLTVSGIYHHIYQNMGGCDSVVNLILNILNGYNENRILSICHGSSYPFGDTIITGEGTYDESFISVAGCDSVVHLTVFFNNVDTAVTILNNTLTAHAFPAIYRWINCSTQLTMNDTGRTFTPPANGIYAVIVTQNGCTDTSFCYTVNHVGIEEIPNPKVQLYPNPSSGLFYVELENMNDEVTIQVYDLLGKVMHTSVQRDKHFTVDMTRLNSGMYFMVVKDEKNQVVLPVQVVK